jgi:hypothetical protein
MDRGQPRQKVSKTPSQQTSWVWWLVSIILAKQKTGRGMIVEAKSAETLSKKNNQKAKRAGGEVQVVECQKV